MYVRTYEWDNYIFFQIPLSNILRTYFENEKENVILEYRYVQIYTNYIFLVLMSSSHLYEGFQMKFNVSKSMIDLYKVIAFWENP